MPKAESFLNSGSPKPHEEPQSISDRIDRIREKIAQDSPVLHTLEHLDTSSLDRHARPSSKGGLGICANSQPQPPQPCTSKPPFPSRPQPPQLYSGALTSPPPTPAASDATAPVVLANAPTFEHAITATPSAVVATLPNKSSKSVKLFSPTKPSSSARAASSGKPPKSPFTSATAPTMTGTSRPPAPFLLASDLSTLESDAQSPTRNGKLSPLKNRLPTFRKLQSDVDVEPDDSKRIPKFSDTELKERRDKAAQRVLERFKAERQRKKLEAQEKEHSQKLADKNRQIKEQERIQQRKEVYAINALMRIQEQAVWEQYVAEQEEKKRSKNRKSSPTNEAANGFPKVEAEVEVTVEAKTEITEHILTEPTVCSAGPIADVGEPVIRYQEVRSNQPACSPSSTELVCSPVRTVHDNGG